MRIPDKDAQAIYTLMLKDDRLRCTCDDIVRETSFYQAAGHYHQCMLYQATRAIELSYRYFQNDPTLMNQIKTEVKTNE